MSNTYQHMFDNTCSYFQLLPFSQIYYQTRQIIIGVKVFVLMSCEGLMHVSANSSHQ